MHSWPQWEHPAIAWLWQWLSVGANCSEKFVPWLLLFVYSSPGLSFWLAGSAVLSLALCLETDVPAFPN